MGILGNFLKSAAVIGASAIPVIGPVAGPIVAGALGGPGLTNKLGAAASTAAGSFAGKAGDKGAIEASASADQVGQRVADNVSSGLAPGKDLGFSGVLKAQDVTGDPLGMMAFNQVATGNLDQLPMLPSFGQRRIGGMFSGQYGGF